MSQVDEIRRAIEKVRRLRDAVLDLIINPNRHEQRIKDDYADALLAHAPILLSLAEEALATRPIVAAAEEYVDARKRAPVHPFAAASLRSSLEDDAGAALARLVEERRYQMRGLMPG